MGAPLSAIRWWHLSSTCNFPITTRTPSTFNSASHGNPLDQLERLDKLHEQGVITDTERAEQKKKKLLGAL